MSSPEVVCVGELLWDVLPTGAVLGGAPCNVAFRLHTLNIPVAMVSRIGRDPRGEEALKLLQSHGLNASWIQRDTNLPTGTVDVRINADGNPSYTINRGVAYDGIGVTPELISLVKSAKALCFGTLIQRASPARESLATLVENASSALRVLDINLRRDCYTKETVEWSLGASNVLKLNRSEVEVLGGMLNLPHAGLREFSAALFARFPLDTCVVTLGECGALALRRSGESVYEPGHRVTVVDTIGSGDAFTAGFIASQLRGESLSQSVKLGNALGALVAERRGAMSTVSPEELAEYVALEGDARCEPELLAV